VGALLESGAVVDTSAGRVVGSEGFKRTADFNVEPSSAATVTLTVKGGEEAWRSCSR
jgi:hypothetical protein